MSETIRRFLRARHGRSGAAEFRKILGVLPLNTPAYQYQSIAHMEATAHSLDHNAYEFCIFFAVPRNFLDRDGRRDRKFGTLKYYTEINILILKMTTGMHCAATRRLDLFIVDKVRAMGMDPDTDLRFTGSKEFNGKEADASYLPQQLLVGRASDWPSVALEVGWTESHRALLEDARQWLGGSGGLVRCVIAMKIARMLVTIRKYVRQQNGHIRTIQNITIRNQQQGQIRVRHGPLIIPFQDLFLRQPTQGQGDLVITTADLQVWAQRIWAELG